MKILFFIISSFIFTILPKQNSTIVATGVATGLSILTYQVFNQVLNNYKTRYLDKESFREDFKKSFFSIAEILKDDKEYEKFFINTVNKYKQINNTQLLYGTSLLLYGLWLGIVLSEYKGITSWI